ncbi:MAG: SDR family NAD(P)-dependent oxidoreductase, partial [Treponema sp.]|nr:SDR family NAD(P)-dependent oxidoreductase [Treponema sp.]
MNIKGKSAIVTGGSYGLGRSIVETLASKGVNVLFVYRSRGEEALAIEKKFGGSEITVKAFQADAL